MSAAPGGSALQLRDRAALEAGRATDRVGAPKNIARAVELDPSRIRQIRRGDITGAPARMLEFLGKLIVRDPSDRLRPMEYLTAFRLFVEDRWTEREDVDHLEVILIDLREESADQAEEDQATMALYRALERHGHEDLEALVPALLELHEELYQETARQDRILSRVRALLRQAGVHPEEALCD